MLRTALMLLPILLIAGVGFWFILPNKTSTVLVSEEKQTASEEAALQDLSSKVDLLESKVNTLESSNSALIDKLSKIQTTKTPSVNNSKKSPVLIPINPGGNVDSTSWTNLTSGSITLDPANYPGYKNAYLIINLSVNVGQGTAYAQLVNTANTLAIIPSQVSTSSYSPVTLTSGPFQLPTGSNNYTVQLYTQVPGYPAQAADSFIQITY